MSASDIKNIAFDVAGKVIKSSGEFAKTAKLKLQVSTEEQRLNALYMEIGKKVKEIYDYGGSLGSVFDEKYREISIITNKINELKERVNTIKGVRDCPFCGASVPKESGYCPKCGKSTTTVDFSNQALFTPTEDVPPPIPEQSPIPETSTNGQEFVTCRSCGKQSPKGDKFCLSCGRWL
ncbi:MAG: zinc ribbon domain-containing protein [Clostridiales bacterium]|nr:zinc ribbon domain-containing protein [Clostridiales bacterium]